MRVYELWWTNNEGRWRSWHATKRAAIREQRALNREAKDDAEPGTPPELYELTWRLHSHNIGKGREGLCEFLNLIASTDNG